jgi:cation-transporting ATPase E
VVTAAAGVAVYAFHYTTLLEDFSGSGAPDFVLSDFERYTGLSSDDVGFDEAAATIGAQTALSTFVSYAAFLLILFLRPSTRLFSSWTRPDGDRRPLVLVAALVVTFSGLLFVDRFTDYFGLTHAADPVFSTVLPVLVLWFGVLSLAYRFRVLERALGIPARSAPPAAPR